MSAGASCRTTTTRSCRGRAREYAINFGGHDEIVLMQSFDLFGLQRDRGIAPTEADIRMMAFSFREFTNLLDKGKRLPEIAKPEAPLDAVSFLRQLPVRGLSMKEGSLLARKWRYPPATGSTGFAGKSFGHVVCPSCQPSPALKAGKTAKVMLRSPRAKPLKDLCSRPLLRSVGSVGPISGRVPISRGRCPPQSSAPGFGEKYWSLSGFP